MWDKIGKSTKVATALAIAAALVAGSTSAGAFSRGSTQRRPVVGESSAVGSVGYARAYVSYAHAYVTGPARQTAGRQAVQTAASQPAHASSASASSVATSPAAAWPPAVQAPTVVVRHTMTTAGSPASVVQIDTPEKEFPNMADIDPLPVAAVQQIATELIELPPVTGVAAKAAVLAMLQTTEVATLATLTAAQTTALAALDWARAQVILAFADAGMPETEAALLAKIDAARASLVEKFAQLNTTLVAKFAEARTAVLALDPAELDADAVEIITRITAAAQFVQQTLTQAQATLAAVMTLFV